MNWKRVVMESIEWAEIHGMEDFVEDIWGMRDAYIILPEYNKWKERQDKKKLKLAKKEKAFIMKLPEGHDLRTQDGMIKYLKEAL